MYGRTYVRTDTPTNRDASHLKMVESGKNNIHGQKLAGLHWIRLAKILKRASQ